MMTSKSSRAKAPAGTLLGVFLILFSSAPGRASQSPGSLSPEQKALHVLQRLTFGPGPGDLERVLAIGVDTFIEEQLHPESLDDSDVEVRLRELRTLAQDSGELVALLPDPRERRRGGQDEEARRATREKLRQVYRELALAKLVRATYSRRQLLELMVDFWANHFNVFFDKGLARVLTTRYVEDVLRPHALGKFEDLLLATARSPAMLFYLDNWLSSAPEEEVRKRLRSHLEAGRGRFPARGRRSAALPATPALFRAKGLNENYARELLELHTLGVDAGYTQADVQEVARIFTGWTIADLRSNPRFTFQPLMHESGDKTVMGKRIPSGGVQEGEMLLRWLAAHPATARLISTKLVRRFVADDPPEELVDRATQAYLRTGGDIREVLRSIFSAPQFFSPRHVGGKVKKPLEFVVSALRAMDATRVPLRALRLLEELGEAPFRCSQPTGYPDTAEHWINSDALLKRLNAALLLASGRLVPGDFKGAVRVLEVLTAPPSPAQMNRTRELMGEALKELRESVAGRSLPEDSIRVAFMLGSPGFQKR